MSNHKARRRVNIPVPKDRCQAGPFCCPYKATHERQSWGDPDRWFPACEMHAKAYAKMGYKMRKMP